MLTDPQSITVDGVAISLPLINNQGNTSLYRSADGLHRLKIGYTEQNRNTRFVIRFEEDVVADNPIGQSDSNTKVTGVVQVLFDQPNFGITDARMVDIVAGLKTWLTTTSGGIVERVLGNEH
jgi:hypothetical protein